MQVADLSKSPRSLADSDPYFKLMN